MKHDMDSHILGVSSHAPLDNDIKGGGERIQKT